MLQTGYSFSPCPKDLACAPTSQRHYCLPIACNWEPTFILLDLLGIFYIHILAHRHGSSPAFKDFDLYIMKVPRRTVPTFWILWIEKVRVLKVFRSKINTFIKCTFFLIVIVMSMVFFKSIVQEWLPLPWHSWRSMRTHFQPRISFSSDRRNASIRQMAGCMSPFCWLHFSWMISHYRKGISHNNEKLTAAID